LLEKYGDSDEAEEKIAKEMGWDSQGKDDGEDDRLSIEEMNAICKVAANEPLPEPDPHREGIDWIRDQHGHLHHPLQHRCLESALEFQRRTEKVGLKRCEDDDLQDFLFEFQTTSVKLAGALNGIAPGRGYRDDAFTVAYLKRALDHLHKSQAGLEVVAPKKLLPEEMVAEARKELFEIREGILKLMEEFRGRT
jgi:hypothetical protein